MWGGELSHSFGFITIGKHNKMSLQIARIARKCSKCHYSLLRQMAKSEIFIKINKREKLTTFHCRSKKAWSSSHNLPFNVASFWKSVGSTCKIPKIGLRRLYANHATVSGSIAFEHCISFLSLGGFVANAFNTASKTLTHPKKANANTR